jgi:circadian clock protein KaiB
VTIDGLRMRLYVAGATARSIDAAATLRSLCDQASGGDYELEVIDVLDRPDLAERAKIVATPLAIRVAPPPVRRVLGDLSDLAAAAHALDLPYDELENGTR